MRLALGASDHAAAGTLRGPSRQTASLRLGSHACPCPALYAAPEAAEEAVTCSSSGRTLPEALSPALSRRHVLSGAAAVALAAGSGSLSGPAAAGTAPAPPAPASFLSPLLPAPTADLLAQLEGAQAVYYPGVSWARTNRDRQLRYPEWIEGEWQVTARFTGASFPQGQRLMGRTVPGVLRGSMAVALPDVGAAMDAPLAYRARFVREPEALGGGVVADRVFNVAQVMDAHYRMPVTRRVEYAPEDNPTRLTLVWATPRRETSVISEDLRKAELIINNRSSTTLGGGDFLCAELYRQITQAAAQGSVGDYEVITRYTLQGPGREAGGQAAAGGEAGDQGPGAARAVRAVQRVAAFLQPQDAAYFEAGNKAVALYDYVYDMVRV
ncbi:hypothetical protein HYH03_000406 [Edaphochlamys debaryana]|uniref:DUF6816 domain-containing protein n=1 Tax=Edaphochlamys debaryana TaxID=47281 RepID=A0A835YIL9_9CHLO|nr:hypothetical protein HYH03_000406 [Edaphochlamys debaryana]|eukprot:KAG2501908.1 hypothetical protein HYH03_000406 [Edaphochlamys debaryana]